MNQNAEMLNFIYQNSQMGLKPSSIWQASLRTKALKGIFSPNIGDTRNPPDRTENAE